MISTEVSTSSSSSIFDSLEDFLNYFSKNQLSLDGSFPKETIDQAELYNFLMAHSAPTEVDSLPYLKGSLLILLLHPLIRRDQETENSPQHHLNRQPKASKLRSIALQIIGRCIRRSNRAQIKTIPITVPLLMNHYSDSSFISHLISDLHEDLVERFKKLSYNIDELYSDPLTANLMIVFDYIYLVNEAFTAISYSGKVHPELFYHRFNYREFDICEDYARWRDLVASRQGDQVVPFVFCDYPWIFDLDLKRTLLMASNELKQRHHLQDSFFRAIFDGVQSPHLVLNIRRSHLLQDARDQLVGKPLHHLAKQVKVVFDAEPGIDEGGLKKEFFQLCWQELFPEDEEDGNSFQKIDESTFWLNSHSQNSEWEEVQLNFIGILLALAIYNGVLVASRFPVFLFKKLLNWPLQLEDYAEIDPILVQSLNKINEDDFEFESNGFDGFMHVVPGMEWIELIPGGANIPVHRANVSTFTNLLTQFLLYDSTEDQFSILRAGFESISKGSVIYGFRPKELYALAYGSEQFDLADLKSIAVYEGGYTPTSPQIIWLWSVLLDHFSQAECGQFLAFVTGSERAPIGGLSRLKSFTVTCIPGDSGRLPSAHTCFNTLLLPQYASLQALQEKLQIAIIHNKGFGLI